MKVQYSVSFWICSDPQSLLREVPVCSLHCVHQLVAHVVCLVFVASYNWSVYAFFAGNSLPSASGKEADESSESEPKH